MRIEFTERFRWQPKPNVWIRYEPGMRLRVTRRCAAAAIEAGAAVRIGGDDGKSAGADEAATEA